MKWEALRSNKCPKCGGALYGVNGLIACSRTKTCNFKITEERMTKIVTERNGKVLEQPDQPVDL